MQAISLLERRFKSQPASLFGKVWAICSVDIVIHTLARLSAAMHPAKKAKPKPRSARKDSQGNGCPKAAARKVSLECVRGSTYKTAFKASGSWLSEKKVPLRNVIGRITKVLKVPMSWCDFATSPISTPRKEKTKHEVTKTSKKSGLISNVGEMRTPTTSNVAEAISPRTTPIMVFPMARENRLIGDSKYSSKHL
jgi:hypothetical protein